MYSENHTKESFFSEACITKAVYLYYAVLHLYHTDSLQSKFCEQKNWAGLKGDLSLNGNTCQKTHLPWKYQKGRRKWWTEAVVSVRCKETLFPLFAQEAHIIFPFPQEPLQAQRKAEIFHTTPVPNFIVERGNRLAYTFLQWWISSWREGKSRVLYPLGMQNYPVLTSRKHSFRLVGASLKNCWTSSKGIHPSPRTDNINM